MPPITRSNKMGDIHEEEVGKGVDSSSPQPKGDLVSMMSQMMADLRRDLKQEMREGNARMDAQMDARRKEFETRWKSNQNTLVGALKEVRASRSVIPKSNHLHLKASGIEHVVSRGNGGYKEHVEEGVYDEWHREVEWRNMRSRDGDGGYGRFGMGNVGRGPFGGGYGGNERFGMGNQRWKVEPYGDRFRGDYESRYHEDGLDRRSGGKQAPKSHGEWHSRRDRDNVSRKGFERPIEEEVPYRAQLRPTHRHGGVDTNQMGTPSSHLTTSSSFHFSHKPIDVYGNVPSFDDLKPN